jgi:hypothetical protein
MTLGTSLTTTEAAKSLLFLRAHAPYRFGGKWFVSAINGTGYAYRNKRDLLKVAAKAGLSSLEFATV